MIIVIIDYEYCNYLKKLQYSKYIVHQLKDIVTLRPQCTVLFLNIILWHNFRYQNISRMYKPDIIEMNI